MTNQAPPLDVNLAMQEVLSFVKGEKLSNLPILELAEIWRANEALLKGIVSGDSDKYREMSLACLLLDFMKTHKECQDVRDFHMKVFAVNSAIRRHLPFY